MTHCGPAAWPRLSETFDALSTLEGNDEALNCFVSSFPAVAEVAAAAPPSAPKQADESEGGEKEEGAGEPAGSQPEAARGMEAAREELSPAIVRLLRTQLVRAV